MNITLTNEFTEIYIENYDVAYNSNDIAIFMLKEPFSLSEGSENLSIDEYVELVKANNNFDDSISVNTVDGLTYFSYTFKNEELNVIYLYYTYLYKANDAFWLVQFATPESSNSEKNIAEIEAFAKSISFDY